VVDKLIPPRTSSPLSPTQPANRKTGDNDGDQPLPGRETTAKCEATVMRVTLVTFFPESWMEIVRYRTVRPA